MGLPAQIFVMSWRSELLSIFKPASILRIGIKPTCENRGAHYDSSSLELIYKFHPSGGHGIGIILYQEIWGGGVRLNRKQNSSDKKNFRLLIVAYNLTLEAEWEDENLREHNGEIQQAFGASYESSPRVSVGAEMLHEVLLPAWHSSEAENNFFIGPVIPTAATAGSPLHPPSPYRPAPKAKLIIKCA